MIFNYILPNTPTFKNLEPVSIYCFDTILLVGLQDLPTFFNPQLVSFPSPLATLKLNQYARATSMLSETFGEIIEILNSQLNIWPTRRNS